MTPRRAVQRIAAPCLPGFALRRSYQTYVLRKRRQERLARTESSKLGVALDIDHVWDVRKSIHVDLRGNEILARRASLRCWDDLNLRRGVCGFVVHPSLNAQIARDRDRHFRI